MCGGELHYFTHALVSSTKPVVDLAAKRCAARLAPLVLEKLLEKSTYVMLEHTEGTVAPMW